MRRKIVKIDWSPWLGWIKAEFACACLNYFYLPFLPSFCLFHERQDKCAYWDILNILGGFFLCFYTSGEIFWLSLKQDKHTSSTPATLLILMKYRWDLLKILSIKQLKPDLVYFQCPCKLGDGRAAGRYGGTKQNKIKNQ